MNATLSSGSLPVMRVHYAEILCQLAEERGVRRSDLVSVAGIRNSQLSHPDNFITLDQFTVVMPGGTDRCGDECLGWNTANV